MMEKVEAEGIDAFMSRKIKQAKEKERKEMEKAKQTGMQIKRMIQTKACESQQPIIDEEEEESQPLSASFTDC